MTYRVPSVRTLTIVVLARAARFGAIGVVASGRNDRRRPADRKRRSADHDDVAKIFVPVRSIADALGAQTEPGEGEAAWTSAAQSLRAQSGRHAATVNGMPLTLKHAPFRVRGRVMVELKAVARAFNVRASYDPRAARIDVLTPGIGQADVTPKTTAASNSRPRTRSQGASAKPSGSSTGTTSSGSDLRKP